MTKTFKKSVAFISAAVMVMTMLLYFPSGIFRIDFGLKASAAAITLSAPTEGDGSSDNPYQISTKEELYWFAACVNGTDGVTRNTAANAVLTADIVVNENVLNADGTPNGTEFTIWTPIGTSINGSYIGTFEGKNHTISGLYFNDSSTEFVGLFGSVEGGSVSNVGVVDSYFRGKNGVGGVCGANSGTITNCYNTGNVSGSRGVGGVCGANNNPAKITNCYNTGIVSATDNDAEVGGVCGYNEGTITNCYYLDTCAAVGTTFNCNEGTSKTSAEMHTETFCKALGYHSQFDEKGFCGLCKNGYQPAIKTTHKYNIDGVEGFDEVYEIGNAGQLYWFAALVNGTLTDGTAQNKSANAVLTVNITVNTGDVAGCNGTKGGGWIDWTPISGKDSENISSSDGYKGTFDGDNHTISGLYFNDTNMTTGQYVGLFGYVGSGGKISNVGVENSYFNGYSYVGGVCGDNYGTITNCYNTSAIKGSGYCIGGVCGDSCDNYGIITNCYNTGDVSGTSEVGGVCGNNDYGSITKCYNTGTVKGTNCVGSVCGYNYHGSITNCYFLEIEDDLSAVGENDGYYDAKTQTAKQFASGEVCYLLNDKKSEGTTANPLAWYQNIDLDGVTADTYPVLDSTHGTVYQSTPCPMYSNTNGKEVEHNCVANADYTVHTCTKCGETHDAVFTANDSTDTISVCCGKGSVTLKAPTGDLTYDGTSKAATVEGEIEGFTTPKILYTKKDEEETASETAPTSAGTYIASITYTISKTDYSVSVEYTIEHVENAPNLPKDLSGCVGAMLSTVSLNEGWSWDDSEQSLPETVGESITAKATYNGEDKDNYNITAIDVTVTAKAHVYSNGLCDSCGDYVSATKTTGKYDIDNNGTKDTVYEISNAGQLYWFAGLVNGTLTDGTAQNTSANAVLTADITLNSGLEENKGLLESLTYDESGNVSNGNIFISWTPIGNYDDRYTGTFDGQGHTVSGLYFNDTSKIYVGLFSCVGEDGSVSNVGVVDSYFNGLNCVGGVCGLNYGTITNCYNTGNVSGNKYVGGVCGLNYGTITNCYNTGNVSGNKYVGGVCGYSNSGSIANCYNTGKVSGTGYGTEHVGGVCGDNRGTIQSCYNTGEVKGTSVVGGVCGYNSGTVTNCYNTGEVKGTSYVGGVCGYNSGTVTNCCSLETEDGLNAVGANNDSSNAKTKTDEQFASGEVCYLLNGTDNVFTWRQTIGEDALPVWDQTHEKVYASHPCPAEFSNTKEGIPTVEHDFQDGICTVCGAYENELEQINGVYQLKTVADLYWFAEQVTSGKTDLDAVLVNNITINTGELSESTTDAKVWTPIGNKINKYTGTFDGQGFTVSGLYFNDTSKIYVGLFSCLGENGSVSNVGVVDSYFNGLNSVGGVCGYNEGGTITNCYSTGTVSGNLFVGGVCGYNISGGTIQNCYNTGTVSGNQYVGGVCGINYSRSTITNCYNTGKVSGTCRVGGVCGDNRGTIENCYNTGEVTRTGSYVGGVCGYNISGGTIQNCYNTGKVSGTSCVGGVCGYNGGGTITNCYYLENCNAQDTTFDCTEGTIKTAAQFASGEVAYLLQSGQTAVNGTIPEVWGQTLTGENKQDYPVLGGKKVLTNSDQSDFVNDIIIYGQNAALDGTIDFNIYVAADDNYEWSAKIDGAEVTKPAKDENGLYKFTCKVAAKDIAKDIEFYINENVKATVSVKTYLDALDTSGNKTLTNLVAAMKTYGTAADKFFNGSNVDPVDSVTAENLSGYAFTKNDAPEGISYYGSSLLLKSETTVRHYFKLAEGKSIGEFTFTVNGSTVTPVEKQDYYYIDIENISADKLGTGFTVSINGEDVITNYSALSYVYKVLDSDSTDDNLKNLVKTLYLYNQNALVYNAA